MQIKDVGFATQNKETKVAEIQCSDSFAVSDSLTYFSPLGLISIPVESNGDGSAQAITEEISGEEVVTSIKDERFSDAVGNLSQGDTALYSAGPNRASKVILKDSKRIATISTLTEDEYDLAIILNGEKGNLNITVPDVGIISMSKENGILLGDDQSFIKIKGGIIEISGNVILGSGVLNAPVPVLTGVPVSPPTTPILGIPSTSVVIKT